MIDQKCLLHNLQNLADAVVAMFGRNCEACVHDLTILPTSLVYIRGEVTHRKPGAPATDLLMKMVSKNTGRADEYHSYKTISSDGKSLKSSTTLFRDAAGRPVAAFCINFDTTEFFNASQALLPFSNLLETGTPCSLETFAHSAGETVEAMLHHAATEIGKHPSTMNVEERGRFVAILEENRLFQFKGAVEQIARLMGVTRFTVYNYLKKIRSAAPAVKGESASPCKAKVAPYLRED
jgi:predicted transcriptional regulator YheO